MRERVRQLKEAGVEAVAVCFLFSYLNPAHERRVAEIVREEFPEAFLSVSSRGAAAVPRVRALLDRRPERVRRPEGLALRRAGSRRRCRREGVRHGRAPDDLGGGVATAEAAIAAAGQPADVGPGRRRRRRHLGRASSAGYDNVITLDIGGTSADIGVAQDGQPADEAPARHEGRRLPGDDPDGRHRHDRRRRRLDRLRRRGRRLPRRPALGGRRSRARPRTAAAARSRPRPTRRSCSAGCGPRRLLGGGMSSAATSRARPFADGPRDRLGMSVEEASMGAVQILTHSMAQSIEQNSVRKGYDPRDFALVAEGGAGPLFARADRARGRHAGVLVPPLPGHHRRDRPARDRPGVRVRARPIVPAGLDARRGGACRRSLRRARGPGARASSRATASRPTGVVIQRIADCRYARPGLRAARRRRLRRRSTTTGSRSYAPTSTTRTSASTRAASRTPTSRSQRPRPRHRR